MEFIKEKNGSGAYNVRSKKYFRGGMGGWLGVHTCKSCGSGAVCKVKKVSQGR